MTTSNPTDGMRIDVLPNGPYKVSGGVPLTIMSIERNEKKEAIGWKQQRVIEAGDLYMLCRCGHSANKPFCDGAHVAAGFDGTETASKELYMDGAEVIEGNGITLYDKTDLCIGAEFCDRFGGIWNLTRVTAENAGVSDPAEAADLAKKARAAAVEEALLCPSGRLVMHDVRDGDVALEPTLEPSIALIEDPIYGASAAIWVRGGIPIFDEKGEPYEVRNRVTLCRCGHSENKPFCDGRHYPAEFNDGLV